MALALVTPGAALAQAGPAAAVDQVPADPTFGGTLYLADAGTETDLPVGASVGWNDAVLALPAPGDLAGRLPQPAGAESVVSFVGPQGHESDPGTWNAVAPWGLTPPGMWLTDVTPYHFVRPGPGTPSGTNAVARVSGDYSLGIAYLKDGGQHVVAGGLYFVHIHLTGSADPDKATYTWQPVAGSGAASGPSGPDGPTAAVPVGLLSLTSRTGDGTGGAPLGALAVAESAARGDAAGWTLTISTGAATRTLAAGAGDRPFVDTSSVGPTVAGATTITLTLVSS